MSGTLQPPEQTATQTLSPPHTMCDVASEYDVQCEYQYAMTALPRHENYLTIERSGISR